jgi:AraC family transcriptional regulator
MRNARGIFIYMKNRIEEISEKRLVGKSLEMSLMENKTFELWRSFMPVRNKINGTKSDFLYSVQVFPVDYYKNFSPATNFVKWAAMEVNEANENFPEGMEMLVIPAGKYVVFEYKGLSNNREVFQYIFDKWLPNSGYQLDDRPHFEVLGEKYKNNDPESEEEIWIPVK